MILYKDTIDKNIQKQIIKLIVNHNKCKISKESKEKIISSIETDTLPTFNELKKFIIINQNPEEIYSRYYNTTNPIEKENIQNEFLQLKYKYLEYYKKECEKFLSQPKTLQELKQQLYKIFNPDNIYSNIPISNITNQYNSYIVNNQGGEIITIHHNNKIFFSKMNCTLVSLISMCLIVNIKINLLNIHKKFYMKI